MGHILPPGTQNASAKAKKAAWFAPQALAQSFEIVRRVFHGGANILKYILK
jgi:hypothetical protein